MATTTTNRTHGHITTYHDHCRATCHVCGPDADAWALGELVGGVVVAIATAALWVLRHPGAALALLALAATLALAFGAS